MKDTCPGCGGEKDRRAKTCLLCRPVHPASLAAAKNRDFKAKRLAPEAQVARLLATAEPRGDCLLATYGTKHDGYRRVHTTEGRFILAHRLVYMITNNVVLTRMQVVDHTCHNADLSCDGGFDCWHRRCINPEHLEVTTIAENWTRADTWTRRRRSGHV